MGQNQVKAGLKIRSHASTIVNAISSKLHGGLELKSLTYEQFLYEIELMNQIIEQLTQESATTVCFQVVPGTGNTFLWKATTRISCKKIQRQTGEMLSIKSLTLRRFIRLYSDVMHQISAASEASSRSEPDDLTSEFSASLIFDGFEATSLSSRCDDNECCICMERDCEVILTCTHGFCEQCIEKWSGESNARRVQGQDSTCPICRDPLEKPTNHWVLTTNDSSEKEQIPELVLGLVDKASGKNMKVGLVTRPHSFSATTSNQHGCETRLERANTGPSGFTDQSDDAHLTCTNTPEGYTLISHSSDH